MRSRNLVAAALCVAATPAIAADGETQGVPAKRAGAFLGVHFDLHAGPDNKQLGQGVTPEHVQRFLDAVEPDYVQIDCKGHPGYSSYPTEVGNRAGGFVGDPLRTWRDVTATAGVPLVTHYSGVIDGKAVKVNPRWAARDPEGELANRGRNKSGGYKRDITSVFGPYVDELLIPQLRELAGDYGVDGVWIDGECWGLRLDYSDWAEAAYRAETGRNRPPSGPDDSDWDAWRDFHREGFREYCRHYVAEVKRTHPDFEIVSNWAFGPHMPEPVTVPFDSLSGDYSSTNSINSARFAGRCYENQGMPWDLMAWGFHRQSRKTKTAEQLMQEASIVLALGGGFQCYFKQDGNAKIKNPGDVDVMAEVAKFCRARQPYCFESVAVPQVGVVYSRHAQYRTAGSLFSQHGPNRRVMEGVLKTLLADRHSVQIVSEHHLAGRMNDWPVLVVPGWDRLEQEFRDELAAYAKNGGRLVLVGDGPRALFADELDRNDYAITAVPFDPQATATAVEQAFPERIVRVSGSDRVDVGLRTRDGRLGVHLVNTAGPHEKSPPEGIKTIPSVGPLTVSLRLEDDPTAVTLHPFGRPLEIAYADGVATVVVPEIDIYSILVVD